MANLKRIVSLGLATSLVLVAVTACGGSGSPAPAATKAPDKAAPAATSAPAQAPAGQASAPATSGGDIPIVFTAPVTGASAAEGALQIKALKLGVKQINEAGGINGKKINLIVEDNQSTNPGALAALQKAVEQDKALVVVGPVKSTQIQAMSDTVKGYGIPFVMGGTNAGLTKAGNPWLFRMRPDDSITAAAMVKYIKEDLKLTKVGIIHDTDAFGTGGADLVEQGVKDGGMTMVRREKYTTKDKDFTAQLLNLKQAGAEVMVVYGTNPEDVAVIQRQYAQLGKPFKYIGSPSSGMRDCLNLSKENSEGLLAVADYVPGVSDASKKYAADYKKEYNEEFDATSAWTYDGINVVAKAIKTAGEDKAKIKDAVLATKGYTAVLGDINFSSNGDALHSVSVVEIQKNAWSIQEPWKLLKVVTVGN
jgi:branched-chain amino acid transport system substrate-binding protein